VAAHQARHLSQRGQWRAAVSSLDEAIQLGHAEPVRLRLSKVAALSACWEIERARDEIAALSKETDLGPHAGEVLCLQGDILLMQSDEEQAVALIKRGIDAGVSKPTEAYARALLADSVEEAIAHLRSCLALEPFHPEATRQLVALLLCSGQRPEAKERAIAASRLFPDDPSFPLARAVIAKLEENVAQMEQALEELQGKVEPQQLKLARDVLDVFDVLQSPLENWEVRGLSTADSLQMIRTVFTIRSLFQQATGSSGTKLLASVPPCLRKPYRALAGLTTGLLEWFVFGSKSMADRFAEGIQDHPDGMLHFLSGIMYIAEGSWLKAEEAFSRAASQPSMLPGVDREALFGMVFAQAWQWKQTRDRDTLARSIEVIQRRLAKGPLSHRQGKFCFDVSMRMGDAILAQRLALQQLHERPNDAQWLAFLARAYREDGQVFDALRALRRLIELPSGRTLLAQRAWTTFGRPFELLFVTCDRWCRLDFSKTLPKRKR
jgi:tetratricopeptide (TPR) repeat protein